MAWEEVPAPRDWGSRSRTSRSPGSRSAGPSANSSCFRSDAQQAGERPWDRAAPRGLCWEGGLLALPLTFPFTTKETYEEEGEGASLTAVDRKKFLSVLLLIKCLWPTYCMTFPERPQKAVLGWQGQMEPMEPSPSAWLQPVGPGWGGARAGPRRPGLVVVRIWG